MTDLTDLTDPNVLPKGAIVDCFSLATWFGQNTSTCVCILLRYEGISVVLNPEKTKLKLLRDVTRTEVLARFVEHAMQAEARAGDKGNG